MLYIKWYRSLYSCLLLVIKIQMLIDFHQTFGRLIKSLGRIIFRMGKPCAKDVFTLQNMCQLKLIFLSRFQERVPMYFRISTAQIRDSVLHRPIIRIVLITAQSQLPDIAGGRHITQATGSTGQCRTRTATCPSSLPAGVTATIPSTLGMTQRAKSAPCMCGSSTLKPVIKNRIKNVTEQRRVP